MLLDLINQGILNPADADTVVAILVVVVVNNEL